MEEEDKTMKKNILLILFAFITCFVFADELHLKKIIKSDYKISFTNSVDSFLCSTLYLISYDEKTEYDYYFYNGSNSTFRHLYHFDDLYDSRLFYDPDKNLYLINSDEIDFSVRGGKNLYKYYLINENDFTYQPTGEIEFYKRKTLPSFLRYLNYLDYYLYAPIKEYCLIVKDVQGHGIEINELHPEKHAYHDMDLVLIDKKGNVCSVLPFTFDDQTASKKDYVEVSADGKYIKIYASSGYILGHIDESLVEKYPELDDGSYYFIYEIVPDNTPYENTEVLDFMYDLEVNEEILIESEFKNYSAFNVKNKEEFNEKNKQGIINDTRVRHRSEPNLSCETLGYLEKGDAVKIVDRSDEKFEIDGENWYWYQVKTTDEQTGWVYGKYLDIENE